MQTTPWNGPEEWTEEQKAAAVKDMEDAVAAEEEDEHCPHCDQVLRELALSIAVKLFGDEVAVADASELVDAAKLFEAYIKGE